MERKTSKKLSLLKKELGIESQEDKRMGKKYISHAFAEHAAELNGQ